MTDIQYIISDAMDAAEACLDNGFYVTGQDPAEAEPWPSDIDQCQSYLGRQLSDEEYDLWISTFRAALVGESC